MEKDEYVIRISTISKGVSLLIHHMDTKKVIETLHKHFQQYRILDLGTNFVDLEVPSLDEKAALTVLFE